MYRHHQPLISSFARSHPDNMGRLLQFVILTIRQPLYNVPTDIELAEQGGEESMGVLFGFKFKAYTEAWENRAAIHAELERLYNHWAPLKNHVRRDACARAMITYLAGLWGFGPVKAGFVAQLAYGLGGCIDTHNLKRFSIPERAFSNFCQRKQKGREAMVRRYVDVCYSQGGPEALWDGWCEYVATKYPKIYRDADHVSELHCTALGLSVEEEIPF